MDKDDDCYFYVRHCSEPEYAKYMCQNCKRSCDKCTEDCGELLYFCTVSLISMSAISRVILTSSVTIPSITRFGTFFKQIPEVFADYSFNSQSILIKFGIHI